MIVARAHMVVIVAGVLQFAGLAPK